MSIKPVRLNFSKLLFEDRLYKIECRFLTRIERFMHYQPPNVLFAACRFYYFCVFHFRKVDELLLLFFKLLKFGHLGLIFFDILYLVDWAKFLV